jgi:hypothetical protein
MLYTMGRRQRKSLESRLAPRKKRIKIMKITKSQLRGIIKEELLSLLEQLPPSPTDVADTYASSLSGGKFTADGEERELDRLEEPVTQGVLDVLGFLKNPETIALAPNGPEGQEDIIEQIIAHKGLDPSLKPIVLELFLEQVSQKLPNPEDGVQIGQMSDPWGSFTHMFHVLKMRMKPARIADVGKERMRAERSALGVVKYVIDLVIRRAEKQYKIGGKTGLSDIEDWPEQEAPPSEEEIEDISGTVGHARLGERKKRRRK